ncbi:MAG: HAMP domain-containing histidine kinase [Deltaproteobacteria bacterium]|nr:HAMP domain-containing histidine kinase [Deltaproteobacteria bacterium]
MDKFKDEELVEEIIGRLRARDEACRALKTLTGRLEALNRKLLESEKAKSHFLSNIRNEINNPLTSVLTLCEVIVSDEGGLDMKTVKSFASAMYKDAFNLSFQLRNIFLAAELESGEAAPSVATVDINALIRGTMEAFQHRAAEKGLKVTIDTAGQENIHFQTDAEKLQCVIANLLANAIEYSCENSSVEIIALRDGETLKISVADHGAGIEEKDHGAIFDRFRQLDAGATKRHAGHGLGLSVTRSILELLEGTIRLASRKGQGAEFEVSLPESEQEKADAFYMDGNEFFFSGCKAPERF